MTPPRAPRGLRETLVPTCLLHRMPLGDSNRRGAREGGRVRAPVPSPGAPLPAPPAHQPPSPPPSFRVLWRFTARLVKPLGMGGQLRLQPFLGRGGQRWGCKVQPSTHAWVLLGPGPAWSLGAPCPPLIGPGFEEWAPEQGQRPKTYCIYRPLPTNITLRL